MVRRQASASSDGLDSSASNGCRRRRAMSLSQAMLVFVVLAPGVVFAVFGLLWLLGWTPNERFLSWITALTFAACAFGIASLAWTIASRSTVTVTFGNWFAVGDYHFPLVLIGDALSLPFLA